MRQARLSRKTDSGKCYDRAYFDRWYRGAEARERRLITERKAALAVSMAEFLLGQPVRRVLDVCCGEAGWRAPLLKLRPTLQYQGLDSSEYAVRRFGRSRDIGLARFAQLAELRFSHSVDLLICSDALHYIATAELKRGLSGFAELCHGLVFADMFCAGDGAEGDDIGFIARRPAQYRRWFADAGLRQIGPHCYATPALLPRLDGLEAPPE
ncbi:class I SAM-dependent methyltransferase [Pseudomarimonas arenosa]|uniref:Class I SAM-dependent methyltransferase n=1 Tax=Pseudomarimonas arenosa TaxID=2774145 RepID=A0AAW3ZFZ6_9GAMM|nr:class I SAM-dependent methyltransferase [Pseudomarimonas arenosa]MBD8524798.1 class I SAM-dependent methyltransferase [Pseudomarimonas arenosa]